MLQPAVNLADGFVVHERLARSLQSFEERLRGMPAATTLLPDDGAQRVGDRLVQSDLADTLHRIALEGRDGFYRGHTADLIEAEMRRGGGLISHEDLARYEARWRDPMVFTYRDHWVVAMPPSSSGGATLGALLRVLEGYDLRALGHHSPEHVHLWR